MPLMSHNFGCKLYFLIFGWLAISCSSTATHGVLEPVEEKMEVDAPPTAATEAYSRLSSLLGDLDFEGVGLEHEALSTLELLVRVFSDPRIANRKIKLVYTGLKLSYDPTHQSVTIGGTKEFNTIIEYVQKNIPLK